MSFKLTILGCNSAIPTSTRFTTSQILSTSSKVYLIDCGEGTQIRLKELKIKVSKLDQIFISHLHGDHFFGLPGLITSLNLSGRTHPLTIYGPVGLKKFIATLMDIGSLYLGFELNIIELDAYSSHKIFEDKHLHVHTIPLKHRIPTTGFLFRENEKPLNIIPDKIKEHHLTIEELKLLKKGQDLYRNSGETLRCLNLTKKPPPPKSYAFCSDTIYDEELIPIIENVDLLYHEATYLHALKEKALERGHSTAIDAAKIAAKAKVRKLVLGHYSSRYKDIGVFKDEAAAVFENAHLAEDGKIFEI